MARTLAKLAPAADTRAASLATAAPTPRYYRVYVAIQKLIRDSVYGPGQRIPTEAQLCRQFKVSRITVRRSLYELQRDGWLSRQQGLGTFVSPGLRLQPVPVNWSDVFSSVSDLSQTTGARDLSVKLVKPDADTRAALHLFGGAPVQRVSHVRLLHGEPLGLVTNWVPQDIAGRLSAPTLTREPTLTLLEQTGVRIGDSRQTIGATLATPKLARALGIPVGAPLVRVERVVYDDTGRGVERMLALYRADRYQYRMALTRHHEGTPHT